MPCFVSPREHPAAVCVALMLALSATPATWAFPSEMLPDLHVLASYMPGWTVNNLGGNNREIRFSAAFANGGQGALHLFGGNTYVDQLQTVSQRVFNNDATFVDHVAGYFTYHPSHGHIHVDQWAAYRLRLRPANQSVGPVVAENANVVSFCLIDISHYNPGLPGSPASSVYNGCTTTQGISVGWSEVFSSGLDGQSINITGVANGDYWLEAEVDPRNHILESNETNNITRIPITLAGLPAGGFNFTQQPVSQTIVAGASASFAATPQPVPASQQWYRNGVALVNGGNVSGATTGTLTINPVNPNDAGVYHLTVQNGSGGALNSSSATLTVSCPAGTPPVFTTQPAPATVVAGTAVVFTAAASGEAPMTYQWRVNGVNLSDGPVVSGSQTGTLSFAHTSLAFSGLSFDCVAANCSASTTSSAAVLTVNPAPTGPYIGPNAFGYLGTDQTAESPPSSIGYSALTFTPNNDDGTAPLNLGADTFNYFGSTFTGGASVFASSNGLVTFGSANTAYDNSNLGSVMQPAIAVLWDDWIVGSGTPQARYKRIDINGDAVNDWLVIEWNQVYHYSTSTNGVTFRAHLRLNTAPLPGDILLAYPDVITGNAIYSFGASATVGIKPSGAGGWLLWSNNQAVIDNSDAVLFTLLHVAAIERLDPNPAPAGVVRFRVRFAPMTQPLIGLDASDFGFAATGTVAGAIVTNIAPPTAAPWDEYIVTTHSGTGVGTLRLNVVDNATVFHPPWGAVVASYPLGGTGTGNGTFTGGETYDIVGPPCPADIAGADGQVNVTDLLAVIIGWGTCPGCPPAHCPADITPIVAGVSVGDCSIDVTDLLAVITAWGPCP